MEGVEEMKLTWELIAEIEAQKARLEEMLAEEQLEVGRLQFRLRKMTAERDKFREEAGK